MTEGLRAELSRMIGELVKSGTPLDTKALRRLAGHMARAFHVEWDEVAILALTKDEQFLSFLVPERLG